MQATIPGGTSSRQESHSSYRRRPSARASGSRTRTPPSYINCRVCSRSRRPTRRGRATGLILGTASPGPVEVGPCRLLDAVGDEVVLAGVAAGDVEEALVRLGDDAGDRFHGPIWLVAADAGG